MEPRIEQGNLKRVMTTAGDLLVLSLQALAILYVLTNFPFPHLEFVYEGF